MLAAAHASGDPYPVVVLDEEGDGTGATAFAAALARDPRLRATAVLLLTSRAEGETLDPERARLFAGAGFLTRPIWLNRNHQRNRSWCRNHSHLS